MVFRTLILCSGAKRVPLIKFRKGGYAAATANQASPPATQATSTVSPNAIEDFELPSRYSRKPIDPVEMEYINRGGPA